VMSLLVLGLAWAIVVSFCQQGGSRSAVLLRCGPAGPHLSLCTVFWTGSVRGLRSPTRSALLIGIQQMIPGGTFCGTLRPDLHMGFKLIPKTGVERSGKIRCHLRLSLRSGGVSCLGSISGIHPRIDQQLLEAESIARF